MIYRFCKKKLSLVAKLASLQATKGREVCGLLVYNDSFIDLVLLKNTAPEGSFAFDTREVRKAQNAAVVLNYRVVGVFHSHPLYLARPSQGDLRGAKHGELNLIYDVLGKEFGLWKIIKPLNNKVVSEKREKFELRKYARKMSFKTI